VAVIRPVSITVSADAVFSVVSGRAGVGRRAPYPGDGAEDRVISNHDRDVLEKIEAELARSDPAFAARMRSERGPGDLPAVFLLCVLFYFSVPVAALLFGWPGLIVAVAGIMAGVAAVTVRRCAP
jgi:hypothetical protein